jgi:segregation and condensation protein A
LVALAALRQTCPRTSGRHGGGEVQMSRGPSPDASLGDGVFAARKPPSSLGPCLRRSNIAKALPTIYDFRSLMAEYQVQFEVFEGPLDLLLYLIKKEEVDIYEVNLTKLATQFIEYIDLMRAFDLEVAGEFVVMAASLMYIKSRELLPVDQQVAVEPEDEGEDPRFELIRQLVEYKKFKDAAASLQTLEERQENVYPRLPGKIEFHVEDETTKLQVSIFDLLNAVNSVLKRFQDKTAGTREIYEDKWTVSEKMEFVLKTITERPSVKFSELFAGAANRAEVVCTFLALLELIRLKQLACVQSEPFAEIEVTRAIPSSPSAENVYTAPEFSAPAETKVVASTSEPAVAETKEKIEDQTANDEAETDEDEDDEDEEDEDEDDEDEDDEAEAGHEEQKPK